LAASGNRFQKVSEGRPDAVAVELWSSNGRIRGSVICPTEGRSGQHELFVSHEAGMSGHEALATACHLANVDGFEVVVIDPDNLWRAEWGSLHR
jgi:hypothetical protein